ncbi:hypothetical protein ACFLRU_00895 [Bacteroidota bacterium]
MSRSFSKPNQKISETINTKFENLNNLQKIAAMCVLTVATASFFHLVHFIIETGITN